MLNDTFSVIFKHRGSYQDNTFFSKGQMIEKPSKHTRDFTVLQLSFTATLEYLITVQHLLNVHNEKLRLIWFEKKDNLMLLNFKITNFKGFLSINLNTRHVNEMTHLIWW